MGTVRGRDWGKGILVILRKNWGANKEKVAVRCPCCYEVTSWRDAQSMEVFKSTDFGNRRPLYLTLKCGCVQNQRMELHYD